MAQVSGTTTINVSSDVVLAALLDVANAPAWMPSLEEVWDVEGSGAGMHYKWRFKMGGLSFRGTTQISVATASRFTFNTEGGIPSIWDWTLSPTRKGTHLKLTIDYTIPGGTLGSLANKVVEKQNEKEMVEGLANLKALLEAKD